MMRSGVPFRGCLTCARVFRNLVPILALTCVGLVSGGVPTIVRAGAPTYTTFDVPGAGTGDFRGTVPINSAPDGTVVGFIRQSAAENDHRLGFVRDPRGNITTFDAPNAGTDVVQGTHAYSITPNGTTTGWYYDQLYVTHGFVRTRDGVISVFDLPGGGTQACRGTYVFSSEITPNGTITGYYVDDSDIAHGFLRNRGGGVSVFDVPTASGAGTAECIYNAGTQPAAINMSGVIVGTYFDAFGVGHGFVRSAQGSITTFDVPGDTFGTYPSAINPSGAATGVYVDGSGTNHFFVRAAGGAVTTFDLPPGAPAGSAPAFAYIAADGTVAATYQEANGNPHAFLRDAKGAMTSIDVPGAVNGTEANGINANGVVTGDWRDANFTVHGLIRTP